MEQEVSGIKQLIEFLKQKRKLVNDKIYGFANRLSDLKNTPLLLSEIFSYRQQTLEETHLILDKLVMLHGRLSESKKGEIEKINSNVQVRYQSADERNLVAAGSAELVELTQNIEALSNYTVFLKDSIDGLDSMKFAVKNSIDINSMLGVIPK